MADKARHAFGALEDIDSAIASQKIDAYDILFVKDKNGKPYVGWIDRDGNKVIVEESAQVARVDSLPTTDGDENVVYIYNNEGYIWNGTECIPMSKSADLTTLENQVSNLATQIDTKVDEKTVQSMIETAIEGTSGEVVTF